MDKDLISLKKSYQNFFDKKHSREDFDSKKQRLFYVFDRCSNCKKISKDKIIIKNPYNSMIPLLKYYQN